MYKIMNNPIEARKRMVQERIDKAFESGLNISELSVQEIEKARHGVYEDNAENRKLHRVGQEYGKVAKQEDAGEGKVKTSQDEETKLNKYAQGASDEALKNAVNDKNASEEVRAAAQQELDKRGNKKPEKVDINKIDSGELKSIIKILEKKNPDSNDASRYLEEEAMDDDELKNFLAAAEYYKDSSGINRSTQEYCRKWAELAREELDWRNKQKEKNEKSAEKENEKNEPVRQDENNSGEKEGNDTDEGIKNYEKNAPAAVSENGNQLQPSKAQIDENVEKMKGVIRDIDSLQKRVGHGRWSDEESDEYDSLKEDLKELIHDDKFIDKSVKVRGEYHNYNFADSLMKRDLKKILKETGQDKDIWNVYSARYDKGLDALQISARGTDGSWKERYVPLNTNLSPTLTEKYKEHGDKIDKVLNNKNPGKLSNKDLANAISVEVNDIFSEGDVSNDDPKFRSRVYDVYKKYTKDNPMDYWKFSMYVGWMDGSQAKRLGDYINARNAGATPKEAEERMEEEYKRFMED